jgi:hypothetical protein
MILTPRYSQRVCEFLCTFTMAARAKARAVMPACLSQNSSASIPAPQMTKATPVA